MTKQGKRRLIARARRILADGSAGELIQCDAFGVEWIQAAESGDKPKRFSMTAYNGGPMKISTFGDPTVIDLTGITAKAPVPILRDHELSRVVGHADQVENDGKSIKLSGLISGAGPDAAEVLAAAANGFPWKASVGVRPDAVEFIGKNIKTKVNGKTVTGPFYVVRKGILGEVSFVAVGADNKTTAKIAASTAKPNQEATAMKFDEWLKAMGLDPSELRDDQTLLLRAKYDAEATGAVEAAQKKSGKIEASGTPPPIDPPKFDLDGVILAHESHIAVIEAAAEEYRDKVPTADHAKLCAVARKAAIEAKGVALKEQWAPPRLEAEYIKAAAMFQADLMVAERPKGPAVHSSSRDVGMPALEAAFCRSAGVRELEKQFTPEVLEASEEMKALGLQELLLICAGQNGYSGRMAVNDGNLREVLTAAFSTHTITTLLTQTGSKILLEGFNAVPQTWRRVAAVTPVSDFKTVTSYRLTTDLEYEEVGPAGLIPHGTAGQESYTKQAKTYAKMLSLTRQDIINDDLGAFNDLRNRFGIGASVALNKRFWTVWLAAANAGTFWTAARGNYQTGAATALAEAGLNTAVKLFRDAAGPDGNQIGIEPDLILIPSDLEATGRKLYASQEMRDTTATTKYPTTNIYYNKFDPVVVPQLSNNAYTGYSAKAWWLACDPAVLASAVVCFLNGVQTPTIESTDADFNTLGIQFRGYHDFGVAMTEYRASVHSAGE